MAQKWSATIKAGGRAAAGTGQQRADTQPGQDRPGLRPGDRGEHHRPFRKNLDQNAAGADDQEGTQGGVADDTQGQLSAGCGGLAHQHARAQPGRQVVVGRAGRAGIAEAEPDPPDVRLMRDPRLIGLEHDRVTDLGRGG